MMRQKLPDSRWLGQNPAFAQARDLSRISLAPIKEKVEGEIKRQTTEKCFENLEKTIDKTIAEVLQYCQAHCTDSEGFIRSPQNLDKLEVQKNINPAFWTGCSIRDALLLLFDGATRILQSDWSPPNNGHSGNARRFNFD